MPEQALEELSPRGITGASAVRATTRVCLEQRGAAHDRLLVRLSALRRVTHGALLA